ncbi:MULTISPECIES: Lrp/AsnC family transcriptional regulator [Rhodococcus]|jgi:DNA-binding Lrp family transcriptional regulator|uniref:Lrp/AsnC family transcriptional regulator n=1 Tax=Rhodococcus cercidiphylli TaxID=489916 RepID=A0ABU4AUL6_9NOCA|nr:MULTISPECIES: Lrp/AsnC family transcriptional regulator [Rhodococcus]KAA0928023.1 Lrp/AsnC family transcriptional regulator [Rhodococcus sp. ANT_H53B]MDI6630033.1 Lrp/AsnC family transcriptional regulator [Rhodococcus sp. (in: high G+C Gram-positive bacteria)]MDI9925482.1 Lrp/AsnC family transcriptional regulator [Rhodococcus sp. IEGM 1341]MDV6229903.1 Lrp/AsnC family transcriptional regulator [Rhodococcus cercidiphylli]MDV8053710.1 Lrp/AsnC family transcriptional regulator [Rhodococcus sp.
MTDLDKTDARLLLALCAKPRATGVELATTLGLSRNTVQARLGRWDDKGSLTPIDHRIPPKSLGRPLQAFVTAQVNQHTLAAVTEHLRTIPEVLEVFGLSGAADMHIRIAAVDADDLYRIAGLILDIPGVERTNMSIAMSELIQYRTKPLLEQLAEEGRR